MFFGGAVRQELYWQRPGGKKTWAADAGWKKAVGLKWGLLYNIYDQMCNRSCVSFGVTAFRLPNLHMQWSGIFFLCMLQRYILYFTLLNYYLRMIGYDLCNMEVTVVLFILYFVGGFADCCILYQHSSKAVCHET